MPSKTPSQPSVTPVAPVPARRHLPSWASWLLVIAAALVVTFVLRSYVVETFSIPSDSMSPTLQVGDRVLVWRLGFDSHAVSRGDIVVLHAPAMIRNEGIDTLVKRVIATQGQVIEGHDGAIFINHKRISEPYLPKATRSKNFGPVTVPKGEVFLLGDNRLVSRDSTVFGPVPASSLFGRVVLRVWPLSRAGSV